MIVRTEEYLRQFIETHVWTVGPPLPPVAPSTTRGVDRVRNEKWKGPAIPFLKRLDGRWSSRPTRELIISSIYHILTTRVGSRLMNYEFGSSFLDIIFEQNDAYLKSEAITYVTTSVTKWEPRIALQRVDVLQQNNNMELILDYVILETGEPVNASIAFAKGFTDSIRIVRY